MWWDPGPHAGLRGERDSVRRDRSPPCRTHCNYKLQARTDDGRPSTGNNNFSYLTVHILASRSTWQDGAPGCAGRRVKQEKSSCLVDGRASSVAVVVVVVSSRRHVL